MPRSLAEWLAYLESLHPKAIALGLERVAEVKRRLALVPDFPVIIVGGTNGKGSVCAMLESILHAAGYKVGCYTSPHLLRYNERVRIARQEVSDEMLCAAFEHIERARKGLPPPFRGRTGVGVETLHFDEVPPHPALPPARGKEDLLPRLAGEARGEGVRAEIPLTYFEFGTLAAMQSFIAHKVDAAILEVGLGGRLDAVNVFDAEVAVVTSVDLDHTDYLGDTREQIAFEKAGIFRAGHVAVYGERDLPQAIARQAQNVGAELWQLGREFDYQRHGGQWDWRGRYGERLALPPPALRGGYQFDNASAALAALEALRERLPVSMEAVRRGLVEVEWPARFQVLPGRPMIILDVAHNPQAARALAANLGQQPCRGKTFAVIAMLKDKDRAGVVAALRPHVDGWFVAGLGGPRGSTAEEMAAVLEAAGVEAVQCHASVAAALQQARQQAGLDDRIAALGSFHAIAEVMQALASADERPCQTKNPD